MKRRMKRVIIVLMTGMLVLSNIPVNVLVAEEKAVIENEKIEEIIEETVSGGNENMGENVSEVENGENFEVVTIGQNITTGTLGDNNGILWSYDASTKTLTVTGEDGGVHGDYENGSPFKSICSDVANVVFQECKLYGKIDHLLSGLTTVKNISFINFDTSSVISMNNMFADCSSLVSLDISGFNTSNVTNMQGMFWKCNNLVSLDVSGFDTSNVTDMSYMFYDCSNLVTLDVSGFDTSNVTAMMGMFDRCSNLRNLDVTGFNTFNVTHMSSMFSNCSSLTNLDVSGFDTSNVIYMGDMFKECSNLSSLDVSRFVTSNVKVMEYMFDGCSNLVSLDVSNFNTSNVTDMFRMFAKCSKLKNLDVSGFDTLNVTEMQYMFLDCSSLVKLDVSGFDTTNVVEMQGMFDGCSSLSVVDVSGFNTSNVTEMDYMFYGCSSLTSLDLRSFDMSSADNVYKMLLGCSSLNTIYCPKIMTTEQVIGLPFIFYDSQMNELAVITQEYCKSVLVAMEMFTITYHLDGGQNSSQNPLSYNSSTNTIVLKKATKEGYTFKGWYTDKNYKNKVTEIKKGSTGNINLYAKWIANKYIISFNGNGSTSGKMKNMTSLQYGKSYKLIANAYKRTGYEFTGWNTKANGTGLSYANKVSIKNLSSKNGGKVILYAQWKKIEYKITYKLNGGKNNRKNPSDYTVFTNTIILKSPTRKGYTFEGWYTDKKYKSKITKIKKGSKGNVTLYAKWIANKYTISFNGNGNTSGWMKEMNSCQYGKSYKLIANAYKKTGYEFIGWNTKANGSGKTYANKASIKNLSSKNKGKIILYAKWKKENYTITYKLDGGTNNFQNPSSYTIDTSTITLKTPLRKGYTFKGWYADRKYKLKVTKIKKGSTGNKILYAKWTVNKYNISFDGNGNTSGTMNKMISCQYGKTYTLMSNSYIKDGYKFDGWNTKADGSGTSYEDGCVVKNLTEKNGETVTLYAQWKCFVPRTSAPSLDEKCYNAVDNPFSNGYGTGNCTWYAFGRAYEILGTKPQLTGNAKQWWNCRENFKGYSADVNQPKEGAIIVWGSNTEYGHVAVIEEILADGRIVYSESSLGGIWYYGMSQKVYGIYNWYGNTVQYWGSAAMTPEQIKGVKDPNGTEMGFIGYIYLQ